MGLEMFRFNNNSIFKELGDGNVNIIVVDKIVTSNYGDKHYFDAGHGVVLIYKIFELKSKDYNAINNILQIKTEIFIDPFEVMSFYNADLWKSKYKQIKSDFLNEFSNNKYYKISESKSYDYVNETSGQRYNSLDNYTFSNGNLSNNLIYRWKGNGF